MKKPVNRDADAFAAETDVGEDLNGQQNQNLRAPVAPVAGTGANCDAAAVSDAASEAWLGWPGSDDSAGRVDPVESGCDSG